MPVMLRAPGSGEEQHGVGDVAGIDVAPQRGAGGQATGHVIDALAGARRDGLHMASRAARS